MKMLTTTLTIALVGMFATCSLAQQATDDYRTAYHKSLEGDKPLLVLVTASWCPPCQVMKKTTIPKLVEKEAFKNFNFSTVDLDQEEALGRQLMGQQGIPQFVMFEKQGEKWIRRNLTGIQSVEAVEQFMAQAKRPVRLATAPTETKDK